MERRWPDRDTTGKWKRGRAGRLDEALMEEGGGRCLNVDVTGHPRHS